MNRKEGREKVAKLIKTFEVGQTAYKSTRRKEETAIRRELLDPFFAALGWDVDNSQQLPPDLKEVIHEDSVITRDETRLLKPDYAFKLNGNRCFFVEAKDSSVNLATNHKTAFQLQSYSWNACLPLGILTDFEEFFVYDCRQKPSLEGAVSRGRLGDYSCTYKDYLEKWDTIYGLFSREAVASGSLEPFRKKELRGSQTVDAAFLDRMDGWRRDLAKEIRKRNPNIGTGELNQAVQLILDRIIFLRICEDREIEDYGRLQKLIGKPGAYSGLKTLFEAADIKYNSGLFHFKPEKGRNETDILTPGLTIGDATLHAILKGLYYPEPFAFAVMPADILGQVYERFLGKAIEINTDGSVEVNDKPEVKKAGGVFYTPEYIVDYIVRNTVGRLAEGKKPASVAKLKIVDPACGSGAFLIRAYQYLLDWHLDFYTKNNPAQWAKGKSGPLMRDSQGDYRLTLPERKRILLANIHGVDIDRQAMEVTRLSLLLKCLERETKRTVQPWLFDKGVRLLPDLGNNIKWGNSLVGTDMIDQQPALLDDDEAAAKVNIFNWRDEFPEIFQQGGFDAVIGNPPYVRQETLGEGFKKYAKSHFSEVFHGIADLYVYFFAQGMRQLKTGGLFSIIVANKWMQANYGEPLRKWLKEQCVEEIVDFGDLPVFQTVTAYPCIIRLAKTKARNAFPVAQVTTLENLNLPEYVAAHNYSVNQRVLNDKGWALISEAEQRLLGKLFAAGKPLKEYVNDKIYYGIKTGLNEAFVIDQKTRDRMIAEEPRCAEVIKPFLAGRDIKRYRHPASDRFLILFPKGVTSKESAQANEDDCWGWLTTRYAPIVEHLQKFQDKARGRCDQGNFWWELRTCDYYDEFEKSKILWPGISAEVAAFALDESGYFGNDNNQFIVSGDNYLLGILNSKMIRFALRNICDKVQGGFYRLKIIYIQQLPIRVINKKRPHEVELQKKITEKVKLILDSNKNKSVQNDRLAKAADREIDALVYQLYGLTEEERSLVEAS